ncbi:PREDICTED: serine carboxypeptidase-like 50 [Ipomoea nil]|uniref:serine carboxypeptidase-like 50 n=1 Tax=Ipomoea nil TaxID=35883 RepID=UPI000901098C|nr:PREDICTED: serine carboxypeptidase-like 50 [Ipomoea nil]
MASKSLTHTLFFNLLIFTVFEYSSCKSSTPFPQEALPTNSGYLTVNSTTGSAIFYTYYEAQNPIFPLSKTPILIWLQGGPGCSSMLANFYELGPWRVSSSSKGKNAEEQISLDPNPGSWNRIFGLLFLDNPIGAGFSVASTPEEIPRDQLGVAKHLFIAIRKFIASDASFKARPIYITGESYAGKYVPAIGYYTLKKNAYLAESSRVNLAGVAIGNGLTHPVAQVATHAINAYNLGLINDKQKRQLEKLQEVAVGLTERGNWSAAVSARTGVLRALQNMTGLATLYDFRRQTPYEDELVAKLLSSVEIKRLLKAKETITFETCSDLVDQALHSDVMKSVRYMVEFLVKNTKVLLYQGQCDLRDGVVSTEAWIKTMEWEGVGEFLAAERKIWRVNEELAGYVQKWGNLSHIVVLGAGHLVPTDQSLNSQAMIENWVLENGSFGSESIHAKPSELIGAL